MNSRLHPSCGRFRTLNRARIEYNRLYRLLGQRSSQLWAELLTLQNAANLRNPTANEGEEEGEQGAEKEEEEGDRSHAPKTLSGSTPSVTHLVSRSISRDPVPAPDNMSIPMERRSASRSSKEPMTTTSEKPSKGKASRRTVQSLDDPKTAAIRETLQRYLTDMRKDHVYIAKGALAAARLDMESLPVFRGKGVSEGRPGIIYDDVSPFRKMKPTQIQLRESNPPKQGDGFRFKVRQITKPGHASALSEIFVPCVISKVAPNTPLPRKYRAYTTLRNNVVAENEEEMRYLPYFGEAADDEVLADLNLGELFVDKTKDIAEEGKIKEYAAMCSNFIKDFLEEVQVSEAAVTQYLIGDISEMPDGGDREGTLTRRQATLPKDFDLDDSKIMVARNTSKLVEPSELSEAETVCRVFKETTKISIWEVIKETCVAVKNSLSPTKYMTTGTSLASYEKGEMEVATLSGGNPWPYSLDSYSELTCVMCFIFQCPFHARTAVECDDDSQGTSPPPDVGKYKLPTQIPHWSYSSRQAMKDPFEEGETCSAQCFKKDGILDSVITARWSRAQKELLRTSAGVLRNNRRCACLCAAIINKPCGEIYIRLREENLLPIDLPTELSSAGAQADQVKVLKRKKTPAGYLSGYPADIDKTHLHQERADVRPCRHAGPCNSSCECVRSHVTCEKACACPPDCYRKWRGCSCKRGGKPCSNDSKCICQKANRECDPDLCGTCGSIELLDPANRNNPSLACADVCQNVALQREIPKKTMLAHSTLDGIGLFMGEKVGKDEFVGEYKGEIVTNEEADRRGKLYDTRGISFLFNLNRAQVIDATRMGNKLRFINNSAGGGANCVAKVTLVNCVHRIGFWTTKPLRAGEELFFDYGYSQKQIKFVQKEPPFIPWSDSESEEQDESIPQPRPAPGKPLKGQKRSRLEYLNGGKGTTDRSRKQLSQARTLTSRAEQQQRLGAREKKRSSSEYVQDSSPEASGDEGGSEYEEEGGGEVGEEGRRRVQVVVRKEPSEGDEPVKKKGRWSSGTSVGRASFLGGPGVGGGGGAGKQRRFG